MSKIINRLDVRDLTDEERKRVRTVNCGPECVYCGDLPKRGIAIAKMDYFGDVYEDATTVALHAATNEWVVYVLDAEAPFGHKEAARYPVAEVEAIRNLPCELRLYSHTVIDDEPLVADVEL